MKKVIEKTIIIILILLSYQLKAQTFILSVNKTDEFTKEIIRVAPYQSIAVSGLFSNNFTNLNVRKKGNNYFIGLSSQFYLASKSLEDNVFKKGTTIYFKLENDSIAKASYEFDDVQPIVTYDNSLYLWRYNIQFDFSIGESELDKLSTSPMILVRIENGQLTSDIEVREKFRNSAPRNYFLNYIPLLR